MILCARFAPLLFSSYRAFYFLIVALSTKSESFDTTYILVGLQRWGLARIQTGQILFPVCAALETRFWMKNEEYNLNTSNLTITICNKGSLKRIYQMDYGTDMRSAKIR